MLASSMVVAAALLGGAAAQGGAAAVNQLETARLTQAAQRVEFGVEGEKSAFKFSFSDPVRCLPSIAAFDTVPHGKRLASQSCWCWTQASLAPPACSHHAI